jgi:hypothetical protein
MAGAGLPTKEEVVLVIACAGVVGWLLMLAITLCLGAAAKGGDEIELGAERYLPDSEGAEIIALPPREAGHNGPPAWCARRRHR